MGEKKGLVDEACHVPVWKICTDPINYIANRLIK